MTQQITPLAIVFGVLAGGVAVAEGYMVKRMIGARKEEQKIATEDQRTVKSWL